MDATRQPTVRLVLVGTDLFERLPVDVEQPDVRFDALPPEWACFSTSRDRRSERVAGLDDYGFELLSSIHS